LLRAAEQVHGAELARLSRPDTLRTALALAKVGRKLERAAPGTSVSLEESEALLLERALRAAAAEVKWLSDRVSETPGRETEMRRETLTRACPDLAERGRWKSFGLARDIEAVADRLAAARQGQSAPSGGGG
jgi:hypothetical protein